MKKILLIGSKTTDQGETEMMQQYADFFDIGKQGISFSWVHFDQLSIVISEDEFRIMHNGEELVQYHAIIFRGKVRANIELAYCISRYAKHHNIRFFNDYSPYRPASKLAQAVTFFEEQIPFVKTVYASQYTDLQEVVTKELSSPFIVKDSYGSHGNSNYLVRNLSDVAQQVAQSTRFIAQEYFENDCDYRVLCIGEKHLIIRRKAQGESHLNNTSQGGTAELVEEDYLPKQSLQDAHKIVKALKMVIAGVDLLYNDKTGEYKFLEVNLQPQLTTGAFIAQKQALLHEFLKSTI